MTPRKQRAAPTAGGAAGPTPDQILAPLPDPVRRVAEAFRAVVREAVPTMGERAYPVWGGIGFREPDAGYVVGLFPKPDRVDLAFERGARLADPDGLFAPARELRQVRYVELRTVDDARRPELRELLLRAVASASM